MQMEVLLPLLLTTALVLSARQPAAAATTCQRRCGDVDIPYPFGIGRGCYLDTGNDGGGSAFEVTCSSNGTAATVADGFEVLGIDAHRGKLRIRSPVASWCYDAASGSMADPVTWSYDSPAFRVSGADDNRLTVLGCNAFAYMDSRDGAVENRYVLGCRAVCSGGGRGGAPPALGKMANGTCDGTGGCCQAPIPAGIRSFEVGFFDDYKNDTSAAVAGFSPCSYVVLAEAAAFEFRSAYVTTRELEDPARRHAPAVVLDWAVGNRTCEEARRNTTAYACVSANSECLDSSNGPGYLCRCSKGYQGNPYLVDDCQDINECKDKAVKYPCSSHSICINTPGSFKCSEIRWQVAVGVSIGVVVVAIALSCTYAIKEKRRLAAIKKRHFKQHGGLLLFEEMKSKQVQLSFTLFTKEEMEEATNMFDEQHVLGKGGNGTVYKGTLRDGRVVAIKRCNKLIYDERQQREFGKEMLILSQVNHRNIVKLYGCCLEVEVPMLVYQFIPNGTLYQLIHGNGTPPFMVRLKIAHEVAEALAYLHSMASPPIIHGDVKSPNILLDENYTTKVSDFGASALAPTDEAHLVSLVQGTCGYLDPEYMQTCRLIDKSDVYSFGVVLLELLTRRKALALAAPEEERSLAAHFLTMMRNGRLNELLDMRVKGEVMSEVLEMVAILAKQCLEMSSEKRPSMCKVAEELDRIRKLCHHSCLGEIAHSSFLANDK